MKKHIILIVLCFSAVVCYSQTKNGIATYSKKILSVESSKADDIDKKTKDMLKLVKKSLNNLGYALEFSDNLSIFKEKQKMEITNSSDMLGIKLARAFTGFSGIIFRDNQLMIKQVEFAGQQFLINDKVDKKRWKLTNKKMTIDGYMCFKAIKIEKIEGSWGSKEIDIIAWYTPEIAINIGPDGYYGLPGLIIQLEKDKIITYLKKIEFTNDILKIKKPSKGKKVSQVEFDVLAKQISMNRKEQN